MYENSIWTRRWKNQHYLVNWMCCTRHPQGIPLSLLILAFSVATSSIESAKRALGHFSTNFPQTSFLSHPPRLRVSYGSVALLWGTSSTLSFQRILKFPSKFPVYGQFLATHIRATAVNRGVPIHPARISGKRAIRVTPKSPFVRSSPYPLLSWCGSHIGFLSSQRSFSETICPN